MESNRRLVERFETPVEPRKEERRKEIRSDMQARAVTETELDRWEERYSDTEDSGRSYSGTPVREERLGTRRLPSVVEGLAKDVSHLKLGMARLVTGDRDSFRESSSKSGSRSTLDDDRWETPLDRPIRDAEVRSSGRAATVTPRESVEPT